jgi:hypothetical protein
MFNCFAKIRFYPFQTVAIFGLLFFAAIAPFPYLLKKCRPDGALGTFNFIIATKLPPPCG